MFNIPIRDMTYDMIPQFNDNYEPDMLSTLIVLTMGHDYTLFLN